MEGEGDGGPPGEPELRLRRCLDARTRRWASAEFFYSALDRPWFMHNELKVRDVLPSDLQHRYYASSLLRSDGSLLSSPGCAICVVLFLEGIADSSALVLLWSPALQC